MDNKKRALGRGLEQLFNTENLDVESIERQIYDSASSEEIIEVNLDDLRPNPYQPRKVFDENALNELAESIKEHGVFQPVILKKSIKGYEIIAGERRVRASKLAGKATIPAIVRSFTDEQMMEIALLENLQRENLNAMEEAKAYELMINNLRLTQDELAKKVGKSRSHITNMLGLLKLPNDVQNLVISNDISMGHARVLSKLSNEEEIKKFANEIVEKKLPVRDIEKMTSATGVEKKVKIKRQSSNDSYKYIEELMSEKLDSKVRIKDHKIEISFSNDADLNRILEIMNMGE